METKRSVSKDKLVRFQNEFLTFLNQKVNHVSMDDITIDSDEKEDEDDLIVINDGLLFTLISEKIVERKVERDLFLQDYLESASTEVFGYV